MSDFQSLDDIAISPVVGVILMVAVTVILSATVGLFVMGMTESTPSGEGVGESAVRITDRGAGTYVTPVTLGTSIRVQLNGEPLHTLNTSEVGSTVFVPAAPGDTVTVVSVSDAGNTVLTTHEVTSQTNADFMAYYTFDSQSGSTLIDRSGNGNNGSITNATWVTTANGTALRFNGIDSAVTVPNLGVDGQENISAISVFVRYEVVGPNAENDTLQLIENEAGSTGWYIESDPTDSSSHSMGWHIIDGPSLHQSNVSGNTVHTIGGTYDESTHTLYFDGQNISSKSGSAVLKTGDVVIGADSNPDIQNLNGRIYEIRVYYEDLSTAEAKAVMNAMSGSP